MAFPEAQLIDDFNRADENPPPTGWAGAYSPDYGAVAGWKLAGNKAVANDPNADLLEYCYWTARQYSGDVEVYLDIAQTWTGGSNLEIGIHVSNPTASNHSGYNVVLDATGGQLYRLRCYRVDAGVNTQLGSTISRLGFTPQKFGVRREGSTIYVYTDEGSGWVLRGSFSDSTYNSGYVQIGVGGQWQFDNVHASPIYQLSASTGSYTTTGVSAGIYYNRSVTATVGAFQFTGFAGTLQRAYAVEAQIASFAVTGVPSILTAQRRVAAGAGGFDLQGLSATLRYGFSLIAGTGSYSLNGLSALTRADRKVSAGAGAITVTGIDTSLYRVRYLLVSAGGFDLSGQALTLKRAARLEASVGALTFDGKVLSLLKQWRVTTSSGMFVLTGAGSALHAGRLIGAGSGVFTFEGWTSSVLAERLITGTNGQINLNGVQALLYVSGEGEISFVTLQNGKLHTTKLSMATLREAGLAEALRQARLSNTKVLS